MTDHVLVDRTRTKLLPPNSPEKGWQMPRAEAAKLGLVSEAEKPAQERRKPFDSTKAKTPPKRQYTKRK